MFAPAVTGDGAPELATTRSTSEFAIVVVVVVLLALVGSLVVEETVEVAVIVVPIAVAAFTFTITEMFTVVPAAMLGFVQVTVPVAPTAGVVHDHPAGTRTPWNVVFVGVASVSFAV